MKTHALLLAATLFASAASAFAQPATFVAAPPAAATAGGSATYFGVVATHDAQHEQFARLRQALAASRATVVLYEKPDMGVDSTEAATVQRCGESGYARLLAQQHGLPAERLDDPVAEYEYLRARTEPTQLKLYYLLRTCQRLRQNTGASKAMLNQGLQALIKQSASFLPGTEQVIQSPAEFVAAYRRLCPTGGQWWRRAADFEAQAQPLASPAPEAFVQAINNDLRAYRAQRLAQLVAAKVAAGERVLVVLDHRHLPVPTTYAAR